MNLNNIIQTNHTKNQKPGNAAASIKQQENFSEIKQYQITYIPFTHIPYTISV